MSQEEIQYGVTSNNLEILLFPGVAQLTEKIIEFTRECFIKDEFNFVITEKGLGIICPKLKPQTYLHLEAGEFWRKIIKRLESPVEILQFINPEIK